MSINELQGILRTWIQLLTKAFLNILWSTNVVERIAIRVKSLRKRANVVRSLTFAQHRLKSTTNKSG